MEPIFEMDETQTIRIERRKAYREIKSKLQDEWRDKIFSRDQYQCRVCGSKERLQLAHITTVRAFLLAAKAAGEKIEDPEKLEEVMRKAYREDNLVTLCEKCHKAYHGGAVYTEKLRNLLEKKRQMQEHPVIKEYLTLCKEIDKEFTKVHGDAYARSSAVEKLFREIKKKKRLEFRKSYRLATYRQARHEIPS